MNSALLHSQNPKTNHMTIIDSSFQRAAHDAYPAGDYASSPLDNIGGVHQLDGLTSIDDLLEFIYANDIPTVEALLNAITTSSEEYGALRDRIVRRNMADRLVDEAGAILLAPDGAHDGTTDAAEALLIKGLLLAPDFVNAYYWLGEWYRARWGGASPYAYLIRHWMQYGGGSESALQFIAQYQDGDPYPCSARLRERIGADTVLVVHMSDDMRYLDLLEYSGQRQHPLAFIGRIESPNLICTPRDFHTLPTAKQTIAEDLVKRGKDARVVIHRGTCVQAGYRSVFGPAVDTLYYNHVLHETIYSNPAATDAITTIFEIGTGTGFLPCSIIRALGGKDIRVLASDVNPLAIEVARANIERTIAETQEATGARAPHVSLRLDGQSLTFMPDHSVDLLLSNPPYIPTYRQEYEFNPYEGTHVLEDLLIGNGPRVLSANGIIIMLYSSLTAQNVQHYLRESPLVALPLAAPLRVPLDLREINNDPRWIRFLQRHYGLEVDLANTHYMFWHTLHIMALCHPQNHRFRGSVGYAPAPRMIPGSARAPINHAARAVVA